MGGYITADPIGLSGGDSNLYSYVWQDPANWTDISGLSVLLGTLTGSAPATGSSTNLDDSEKIAKGLNQGITKCIEFEQLKWLITRGIFYVILNESCDDDCDGEIEKGQTKDGEPRVKVLFPDSDKVKKDITKDRVKEWELEPRNPKDGRKRKEFDGTEPSEKWPSDRKKRAPRPHEIDLLYR